MFWCLQHTTVSTVRETHCCEGCTLRFFGRRGWNQIMSSISTYAVILHTVAHPIPTHWHSQENQAAARAAPAAPKPRKKKKSIDSETHAADASEAAAADLLEEHQEAAGETELLHLDGGREGGMEGGSWVSDFNTMVG